MPAPEMLEARLSLFGFVPTPATLSATRRPRAERVLRAIFAVATAVVVAPIVFLIPPHIEWVVLTVITGLYWTRKNWIAELVVESLNAVCPRCYARVTAKAGTTLRLPHGLVCYSCHEHPVLELGAAPPIDATRTGPIEQAPPKIEERRPVKTWSPAGSDW